jgi:hypothetical protein
VNVEKNMEIVDCIAPVPVHKIGNILKIGILELPLSIPSIHEVKEQCVSPAALTKNIVGAANLLRIFSIEESLLDPTSPFFIPSSQTIRNIAEAAGRHVPEEIADHLDDMIGLGVGSTPSGDDFSAGFLYCLRQLGHANLVDRIKLVVEGKTTWYSGKFVEYAQAGLVIRELEMFVNSLLCGTEETICDSLVDLLKIGHSSGTDSALGAIIATCSSLDEPDRQIILKILGYQFVRS